MKHKKERQLAKLANDMSQSGFVGEEHSCSYEADSS